MPAGSKTEAASPSSVRRRRKPGRGDFDAASAISTAPDDLPEAPQCGVCMDLPREPVRLPCKCATILCLSCFRVYINNASKCPVCRQPIMSKVRRLCKNGDHSTLVDQELWNKIQVQYKHELEAGLNPEPVSVVAPRLPPDPGELKRQAEELMHRHLEERRKEDEASQRVIAEELEAKQRIQREEEELSLKLIAELKQRGEVLEQTPPKLPLAGPFQHTKIKAKIKSEEDNSQETSSQSSGFSFISPPNKWSCKACTFFSSSKLLRCEMCGTSKSGF